MDVILNYWVEWICGVIGIVLITLSAALGRKYKDMQMRQEATELGVQALLRAQLIHVYNKYMERGELPIYERENIEQLQKQYENLGGNGVAKNLVERLFALPTDKEMNRDED